MTLFDKIRAAVFRDPQVVGKKKGAESPTEVIGGVEVFKVGERKEGADGQVTGMVETPEAAQAHVLEKAAQGKQEAHSGVEQSVARVAHNHEVAGANPASATNPHPYGQSRRHPRR